MDWTISDLQNFLDQNKYTEKTLSGIKWTYFDIGETNSEFALVFIHGNMGSNEIFWFQLRFFKSKYRVISYSLPPIKGAKHLADGIYENLKLNGVKKIVLIGTSFGGYLAQIFSSKYSEMVDGLILSNTFITTQLYYQKYKFILW